MILNPQQINRNTPQNTAAALIRLDRMYESLRYNDFSPNNGLGEIVDNSIDAGAANIAIFVATQKVQKPGKRRAEDETAEIAVADDGGGMNADTLGICLSLGESSRSTKDPKPSMGRFGVGMTLGSISIARRIEVYSRTRGNQGFLYTYIDLDDIQKGNLISIPAPIPLDPPAVYTELLQDSSGTVVILKKCDQIKGGLSLEGLSNYLGRTYRKFIERGLNLFLNNAPVYLHDPLYMSGPTTFDAQLMKTEGVPDPKAVSLGETRIPLEIPNSNGEKADVVIRMSLLPKEWRKEKGAGGSVEAKKRKIDQNEGVSILRADREVAYGVVPYITGKKGQARTQDIDRWWGCEISFPPSLDSYFQVRYIKRGAEPIPSLRDKIREAIGTVVDDARKTVQRDWTVQRSTQDRKAGAFGKAEQAMAKAEQSLPRGKKGKNLTPDEEKKQLELLANAALGKEKDNPKKKEEKMAEIRQKPYSIELVNYPRTILFETVHLLENIVIKLNMDHPFYRDVLQPLCGDLDKGEEDGSPIQRRQDDMKNAILLLLFAYAKAESMFGDHEDLFESLRSQWGTALAAALSQYEREV